MNRKKFINYSSAIAAAYFFGVHDILAGCTSPAGNAYKTGSARIIHLDLITNAPQNELKEFYTSLLEFSLKSEQKDRFTIQAGETTITFIQTKEKEPALFYHFAFNIPENKILKAREWQLKRTALSSTPSQLIDSAYPNDVRHFQGWNAHSVFFWDPAGNLVEYIARHDLKNSADGEFSSKDILCASEIAFIVNDTETIANEIKTGFGLEQYKNGDDNFRAIGDENGLLLMIKKGRVWESHTPVSRTPETTKSIVTIRADKGKKWVSENYPFEIIVKN